MIFSPWLKESITSLKFWLCTYIYDVHDLAYQQATLFGLSKNSLSYHLAKESLACENLARSSFSQQLRKENLSRTGFDLDKRSTCQTYKKFINGFTKSKEKQKENCRWAPSMDIIYQRLTTFMFFLVRFSLSTQTSTVLPN